MSLKILVRVCVLTVLLALIAPLLVLSVGANVDPDGAVNITSLNAPAPGPATVLGVGVWVDPNGLVPEQPGEAPSVGVSVDPDGFC